jgi:agmatinase
MHLREPLRPFIGAPTFAADPDRPAAFAFIGLPLGSPYDAAGVHSPAAGAPDHVREMSWEQECADESRHWDFDLGGPIMPSGRPAQLIDHGDAISDPRDLEASKAFATRTVRAALERGAIPLVVGGDDSIPPIVVRSYEGIDRLNVLHVDAHIDFRQELRGVPDGYSSPIRRIRDLPWVGQIVQVGMRGVGSAREEEVRDALAAGNVLVTADEVHDGGVERVVEAMAFDAPWYVAVDVDGFDPSVTPGTGYPVPGGLTFRQGRDLLRAIAERGLLAGMDIAEIYPSRDVRGLTALTALRLLLLAMGFAVRGAGREDDVLPERVAAAVGRAAAGVAEG